MKHGIFQPACGGHVLEHRIGALHTELQRQPIDLVICPELFATSDHFEECFESLGQPVTGSFLDAFAKLAQARGCAIAYDYSDAADPGLNVL